MRTTRVLVTIVTALALVMSMFAQALQAQAFGTLSGYHAVYAFENAEFQSAAPGDVKTMVVAFFNIGSSSWVKGVAGQEARIATAYPIGTTADFDAGWSNNWLSSSRYAAQDDAIVLSQNFGTFTWQAKVPLSATTQQKKFSGIPTIDGAAAGTTIGANGVMENYGYYQGLNVTQLAALTLTSTTPASPSTNETPVVNGSGASSGETVTIWDGGTTSVASGAAAADGTFALTTSTLAAGSHSLTATGPGRVASNALTYVVDLTEPSVSGASAPALKEVIVTFSEQMSACTSTSASTSIKNLDNYTVDTYPTSTGPFDIDSISTNAGCTQATLTMVDDLDNGTQYIVTVDNATDLAGNAMGASNSKTFVVSDVTGPKLSSVTASAATDSTTITVTVTWNEEVSCTGTYAVGDVLVDDATCDGKTVTLTTAQDLDAGATYTLTVGGETDDADNVQSPDPASKSFTVSTISSVLTVTGAHQGSNDSTIIVTFNHDVGDPTCGTCVYSVFTQNATELTIDSLAVDADDSAAVDITLDTGSTNPFEADNCVTGATKSSCILSITVVGQEGADAGVFEQPASQSVSMTDVEDVTAPTMASIALGSIVVTWSEPVMLVADTADITLTGADSGPWGNHAAHAATTFILCADDDTPFIVGDTTTTMTFVPNNGSTNSTCLAGGTLGTDAGFAPETFTVESVVDAVEDLSFATNANADQSLDIDVPDTTSPTVTSAVGDIDPQQIVVAFDDDSGTMKASSVATTSHYKLNGASLPAGTLIVCVDVDCLVIHINLPADTLVDGSDYQLKISDVTDPSGNKIDPNPAYKNFTAADL